jgi:hypothetical protein
VQEKRAFQSSVAYSKQLKKAMQSAKDDFQKQVEAEEAAEAEEEEQNSRGGGGGGSGLLPPDEKLVGKKARLFATPFSTNNDPFYQDRLGTDIGKALKKKRCVFSQAC